MKAIYRVNQIRSQRAVEREGLDEHTIEKHIGDFETKEEAMEVYEATGTGMEVDKELVLITNDGMSDNCETILTTY